MHTPPIKQFLRNDMQAIRFKSKQVINNEIINEPPHGKTNNLHRRKQRRRSASR